MIWGYPHFRKPPYPITSPDLPLQLCHDVWLTAAWKDRQSGARPLVRMADQVQVVNSKTYLGSTECGLLWRGISVQRINQLSGYVFPPRINMIIAYYCDLGVSKNEVHPKVAALRGKHNDHLLKFWARHFQTDIDKRLINDIKSCSAVWWPLAMDGLVHVSLLNGIVCG